MAPGAYSGLRGRQRDATRLTSDRVPQGKRKHVLRLTFLNEQSLPRQEQGARGGAYACASILVGEKN
jgi:hypothetical protein